MKKNFFFKASVDLVVFEPFNQYEPIYFFELIAFGHDEEGAKGKDEMKDNIFSIAGLKLFRIRDKQNQKSTKKNLSSWLKK
ncbi:MAG: DUF2726 domain-containing protein [Saprospiraceae bacterium]|nr:DUF2726 domain-containing protein [Saprospiraceae bacterium]